jgi:trimeric autotransporter adhesin
MNKKGTACAIAFSILTVGSTFATAAQAATQTQTQGQTLYLQQSQEVETDTHSTINQSESSTMSAKQSATTVKNQTDQPVYADTSSQTGSLQDHTMDGSGDFSQSQDGKASYKLSKSSSSQSNNVTVESDASTSQKGTVTTTGKTTMSESETTLMQNTESQTVQEQSVLVSNYANLSKSASSTSGNFGDSNTTDNTGNSSNRGESVTYANELITTPEHTYRTSFNPASKSNVVAGYAVFDLNGDRLSDTYGSYSNKDNNQTGNYDAFLANTPTLVVVRPVNADGNPVVCQSSVNLYLSTNNPNGAFLSLGGYQTFDSIELQAGDTGATVLYVNHGTSAQFDILNVSTVDPNHHHEHQDRNNSASTERPQALGVETDQTQSATVPDKTTGSDTTAKQSQTVVALTNQTPPQGVSPANQSEDSSQSAASTQQQDVTTADGSKAMQTEDTSIGTTQSSGSNDSHQQSLTVTANQHEDTSSTQSAGLSQSQSVTVQSPIINVTLNQSHTSSSLDESINVSMPDTSNLQGSTVVNVQIGNEQKQWTLGTDNPVTFNESQSINTGDDGSYSHSTSIDYVIGSTKYSVPIS